MILAHTIKGKDHCLTENKPESHNIKVEDAAAHAKQRAALRCQDYCLPYAASGEGE
jgi:hypothetical protein